MPAYALRMTLKLLTACPLLEPLCQSGSHVMLKAIPGSVIPANVRQRGRHG